MKKSVMEKAITLMKTKRLILFISLSVLFWCVATIYSFSLGDNLRFPDEKVYYNDYGQNIATLHIFSSDGITPTAFHLPLYPLVIGILTKIGFGVIGIRLVNFAALYLTLLFVFLLLRQLKAQFSPIISACLILSYPVLFYTAGTLYPQTVGEPLLSLDHGYSEFAN